MNPSTKDEIKGTILEEKGKVKETAGKVTNNPSLEAQAKPNRPRAKLKRKSGRSKSVPELTF